MKINILICMCMLALNSTASAQMTPQQQANLPPSDPSSSQYNTVYLPSLGQGDTVSRAKWVDHWGAFSSANDGAWGSSLNSTSKRQAEKKAVAQCQSRGGKDCKVKLAFFNQCGAVVSGEGQTSHARAPTLEEAVADAATGCKQGGGQNCEVFFKGCSLPEEVQ